MGLKNPFSGIEKDIKHSLGGLGDDIKHGINQVGDETKRGVTDLGHQAKSDLEQVRTAAKREIESEANKATAGIKHLAETVAADADEIVADALKALATAVESATLHKALSLVRATHEELDKLKAQDPELVEAIDALTVGIKLGPMTLKYSNFYERADELADALDRMASHPPTFRRRPLIEMVEALGPTTVDLGLSVEFALVIGSDELGVGIFFEEIQTKLFVRLGDRALKAIGVPE